MTPRAALVLVAATVLLAAAGASAGTTVCVSHAGTPAGVPCYDTIQHGVDAAATGTGGGVVKVQAGTYFGGVFLPGSPAGDNLQIIGAGKTLTIIDSKFMEPSIRFADNVSGVKITNIGIRNSRGYGIDGASCACTQSNSVVQGVRVSSVRGHGIWMKGADIQVVSNEVRVVSGHGIYIDGLAARIKYNTATQIGGFLGIAAFTSQGQLLSNKVTTLGAGTPTADSVGGVVASGTHNTVTANIVKNVAPGTNLGFGVAVLADSSPTVATNKATWAGMVRVDCPGCAGGLVTGNIVTGSPTYGMHLSTTAPGLVARLNKVSSTSIAGILVTGPAGLGPGNGVALTANSVTDTGYTAPCYLLKGSGHELTSNTAKTCGGSGFYSQGDDFLLTSNTVTKPGFSGYAVDGYNGVNPPHAGVTLNGNKVTGAYQQGFALFDSNAALGPDQPTGTIIDGNSSSSSRQDLCNEAGGAFPDNAFATVSTTCDIRE